MLKSPCLCGHLIPSLPLPPALYPISSCPLHSSGGGVCVNALNKSAGIWIQLENGHLNCISGWLVSQLSSVAGRSGEQADQGGGNRTAFPACWASIWIKQTETCKACSAVEGGTPQVLEINYILMSNYVVKWHNFCICILMQKLLLNVMFWWFGFLFMFYCNSFLFSPLFHSNIFLSYWTGSSSPLSSPAASPKFCRNTLPRRQDR